MNLHSGSGTGQPSWLAARSREDLTAFQPAHAIQLESCAAFESILVTTRRSVYEIIVLPGRAGEVMVRGGRFFPEFRRASIAGSLLGRSALKVGSICVGLNLELNEDGRRLVTSRVQAIARPASQP